MLKVSAPAWGTREELGYCQEVGPDGSPVIPLEGTPSQSPLAVPLLGLHCLLGNPQSRLGASREHWGAGERRGEREKPRGVDRERPEMPDSTCLDSCLGDGSLGEPVGAYPDFADVGRPTLTVGETAP